ncbi:hypothetical protein SAMN04488503_2758 [Humidesulfovibrio mexicanus]|jgi:hypothetical protein|uniref:DUF1737 domain-containing protein n=1 Tax=Humidesulfovibrio mexicanus TaxID=147047 RepID=A0A239BSY0_9BACT|nr:DUF1737 domain-containing protein [Humidesulfovibrio mexicanus]SNS10518.1 hypothetical protein SAMN04488503_2758 [Humidesulfovibrio mexicanus]
MKLYRYLTGPDDSFFSIRVSEALNNGWQLHGGPTLAFDGSRAIAGQALVKEVPGDFRRDLDLSKL